MKQKEAFFFFPQNQFNCEYANILMGIQMPAWNTTACLS